MTGGLIGGDQTAESDIVARGVLDARQDAFASQLDEQIAAELDAVEADRDVIGEQRNVNGGGDGAEVIGDLDGIVDRVEGAGGHDGVDSQGLGARACSMTRFAVVSIAPVRTGTRPAVVVMARSMMASRSASVR